MKKHWIVLVMALVMLLAGCQAEPAIPADSLQDTEIETTSSFSGMELYYIVSKEFFYLSHGQAMLLFEDVMRNYKALGIPCFESVRRTRQKIQAAHPELGCSPEVRRARHKNQKAYVDYALDKEEYAKQNHIKVELDDEDTLGIRISAYIPEIKLVFDFPSKGTQSEKDIGAVTAHLCKQRGIQYVRLSNTQNRESVCSEIRKGFGKAHIFITSDSDEDMRQVYDIFFEWRKKGL